MGSDHGTKSGDGIFFLFQQCYRYRLSLLKLLGVLTLLPVVVKVKTYWLSRIALLVPAPEKLLSHSFSSHSLIQRIPLHCRDVAQRFLHCQEVGNETWVLACHRRWCDSRIGGHCEMCAGIGDRNRFMLMEATEALGKCYRVELDYAHPGELIVDSAIYQDPAGWWGELGHFRSYDIAQRLPPNKAHTKVDVRTGRTLRYIPFLPHGYNTFLNYEPCLFHIFFQPNRRLQHQLDRYNEEINRHGGPSIGIHYRTGDVISYGLNNSDLRVHDVQLGLDIMIQCAQDLARTRFPGQNVTYFIATDNPILKEQLMMDQQTTNHAPTMFTTHVLPYSFETTGKREEDAMLELRLLAARDGLVMNERPKNYTGLADVTSTFAQLAKKIGYLKDENVRVCNLQGS